MDSKFILPVVEYESQFLFNGGQIIITVKTTFDKVNIIVIDYKFFNGINIYDVNYTSIMAFGLCN